MRVYQQILDKMNKNAIRLPGPDDLASWTNCALPRPAVFRPPYLSRRRFIEQWLWALNSTGNRWIIAGTSLSAWYWRTALSRWEPTALRGRRDRCRAGLAYAALLDPLLALYTNLTDTVVRGMHWSVQLARSSGPGCQICPATKMNHYWIWEACCFLLV
jgi:hypothetical protein